MPKRCRRGGTPLELGVPRPETVGLELSRTPATHRKHIPTTGCRRLRTTPGRGTRTVAEAPGPGRGRRRPSPPLPGAENSVTADLPSGRPPVRTAHSPCRGSSCRGSASRGSSWSSFGMSPTPFLAPGPGRSAPGRPGGGTRGRSGPWPVRRPAGATSRRSATTQGSGGGHGRTVARRDTLLHDRLDRAGSRMLTTVRYYLRVFRDVDEHGPGIVVLLPRPRDADGGAAVAAPEIAGRRSRRRRSQGRSAVASPRRKPDSAMVPTAFSAPPRRQAQIQARPLSRRAGDTCWHTGRQHGTLRGFRSRGSSGARRPVSGLDGPTMCPPTDTKKPI
jgi:hypothetical protein